MRSALVLVPLFLLGAAPAAAGPKKLRPPPKPSKAVVYTEITLQQALELANEVLDDASVHPTAPGAHQQLVVRAGDLSARMVVRNEGGGAAPVYWLSAGFDFEAPVPLETANRWNRDRLYSRAYVDVDGDIVLESDLDLAEGVTEDRILDHLKTWRMLLGAFADHIGFYDPDTLTTPEPTEQVTTPAKEIAAPGDDAVEASSAAPTETPQGESPTGAMPAPE